MQRTATHHLPIVLLLCWIPAMACQSHTTTMTWQQGPPLVLARSSACAVTIDHRLYVIGGGWTDAYTALTTVEYATVQADGRLSPWKLTARMVTPRVFHACIVLDGYIYAIGGEQFVDSTPQLLHSVERAPLLADGHLGLWEPVAALTTTRRAPVAIAVPDGIYVIGGYNGAFLDTVEYAALDESGQLSPWSLLDSVTTIPRYIHAGLRRGDSIYLLGGHDETTGMATDRTEWTHIRSPGVLSLWQEGPSLRTERFLSAAALVNEHLYLFGGSTGERIVETVEQTHINPDGTLGTFRPVGLFSPARSGVAVTTYEQTVYLIGGLAGGQAVPSVDYAELGHER